MALVVQIMRKGVASTLIRHENSQSFSKINALRIRGIWKHRLFTFVWTENIFKFLLGSVDVPYIKVMYHRSMMLIAKGIS